MFRIAAKNKIDRKNSTSQYTIYNKCMQSGSGIYTRASIQYNTAFSLVLAGLCFLYCSRYISSLVSVVPLVTSLYVLVLHAALSAHFALILIC